MTDKQLDELLRRALAPAEQPPELPQAAPRFPHRKAWMGLAAACLCFVVSAGVFMSMDLGAKTNDSAAPESAFDMMYTESSKAESIDGGAGDLFHDTVCDTVGEESAAVTGNAGMQKPEDPAAPPFITPEMPAPETTEPMTPSADPEKPTASELDVAIAAFMDCLPENIGDSVPLLTKVGHSEQYSSMLLTTDSAVAYFTINSSTGAVVSLAELLNDAALEFITATHPEEHKLAQEEVFYVNNDCQVIVFKGKGISH